MKTLSIAVAILATSAFAQAQQPAGGAGRGGGGGRGGRGGAPQPLTIKEVKPGLQYIGQLYMVAGAGGNSTFRVTSEGVILVDGKLPGDANYNGLMTLIKGVTDQPVKYLIVTHHHADHTGNNQKFLDAGVQIVAHENLNKNLVTYVQDPKPAPASVTYPGTDYKIKLGGVTVELHHFGRAHTSGDTVVYFPDLKVVCLSDTVTTGTTGPLIDYAGGGSATDWTNVLAGVLTLDFDAAIPGNGDVMTRADVQEYKTKFDIVIDRARELVRQGVPKDQLLARIKTDDIGWAPRVPNVDAFYAELSASK